MLVFGVGNHSPEQFLSWLNKEYGIKSSSTTIVPTGKKIKIGKKYKRFILLLTYADLLANFKRINDPSFAKTVFVVFANPFRLHEHEGIIPLDCSESEQNRGIGYTLHKKFDKELFATKVKKADQENVLGKRSPYLPKLVNNVLKESTILSSLMTVIYTIKRTANQKPATLAIARWLYEGGGEKELDVILTRLGSEHSVIEATQERLRSILLSDLGTSCQEALEHIREVKANDKSPNYAAIEKKFSVNAFDLRYLMSLLDNDRRYKAQEKKSIDQLARRD